METKINKLEDIDKTKNPFKVPDNYFAQFNEEIMNRLPVKEIQKPKPVSMWDKAKPWVYMAAMFIGLYFMIDFITKDSNKDQLATQTQTQQQTLTGNPNVDNYWSTVQVSEEEFYQYLENQLVDEGYYDFMYDEIYIN